VICSGDREAMVEALGGEGEVESLAEELAGGMREGGA
jgi:hypothetical protein